MTMSIRIRYFANLKESMGRAEESISAENVTTVQDVWDKANLSKPMPDNILAAVNMDYAALETQVKDGDEVAFFPPVTGG